MNLEPDLKRLLIIRFSSLGDVVLSTVILDALRKALPHSELWMLTKTPYASLFDGDTRLKGVIAWENGSFCKQAGRVRKGNFDGVIDLHANLRSRALSAILLPRKLVRYNKQWLARRTLVHGRRSISTRRTVDLYADILVQLGSKAPEGMPRLWVSPAARRQIEARARSEGIREGERLLGVHPGARWPAKRWKPEGFAGVCDSLRLLA